MEKKIPIMYKVMGTKLKERSEFGKLDAGKAKFILRYIFRVPKPDAMNVMQELHDYGLVSIESNRFVLIPEDISGSLN